MSLLYLSVYLRVIQTKSQEVSMLTPKLLKQARVASRSKQDQNSQPWEDFRTTTHTWAGHVRDLIDATQQANLPWSHTAEQLVKAAETGNHLEAEVHVCIFSVLGIFLSSNYH